MKFVLYPLAAFGAYAVAALTIFRWWMRHAELDEQLDQMSGTPAPAVRPALVEAAEAFAAGYFRQSQAAADRHHCEQIEHDWKVGR